jgi:hypothetical protein
VAGADFLAAFVAKCFLGALAPVDFLAVYLVLAISTANNLILNLINNKYIKWLLIYVKLKNQ